LYGSSLSSEKLKITSVDTSEGITSRLDSGSMMLYRRAILAGKLTKHRGKYNIICNELTNDQINEIEPASKMLVPTVTTKEV
jgi:hypothetical protein